MSRLCIWACVAVAVASGCIVGDDEGDEGESIEPQDSGDVEPLTIEAGGGADAATVAQINPYYGGRFSDLNIRGPVTYQTARRMAGYIANNWPRVSVIGMGTWQTFDVGRRTTGTVGSSHPVQALTERPLAVASMDAAAP